MSNTICQPRFSIDLGVRTARDPLIEITAKNPDTRHHPPRLQHSPSLPNIWFPPHSGPIPPEIFGNIPERVQRPSTPPSLMADTSSLPAQKSAVETEERRSRVPEAKAQISSKFQHKSHANVSFHPSTIAQSKNSQNRYRKEREHLCTLITPPLTPASSIRTTASADSDTAEAEKLGEGSDSFEGAGEIKDFEPGCTRFLLASDFIKFSRYIETNLRNVSRQIDAEYFISAIVDTLLAYSPTERSNIEGAPATYKGSHRDRDILKGVLLRTQDTHGFTLLAFYDVRWARICTEVLPVRAEGRLSQCVGDELGEDGMQAWLSCRFMSIEELIQTVGVSPFVAAIDGGFSLTVQKDRVGTLSTDGEESRDDVASEGVADDVTRLASVDMDVLKDILGTYGDVRSLVSIETNTENNESSAQRFHVEYYDSRDADAAYVNLDNKILSGIAFHVARRDMLTGTAHSEHCSTDNFISAATGPHPSTGTSSVTTFGPPGFHSHVRERFAPMDAPGAVMLNKRSSDGVSSSSQELQSNSIPPSHEGAQSPTYFYTSSMSNLIAASQPHPVEESRPNGHGSDDREQREPRRFEGEAFVRQDTALQCYTPLQECRYCPSRGPSSNVAYSPYYGAHVHPTPPSLPSVYFPPHASPPPSDMMASMASSSSSYSYDGQQLQPGVNMSVPNWMYDHGVITLPGNGPMIPNPTLPNPHPGPYWYADGHGTLMLGGTCYPPQMPTISSPDAASISYYSPTSDSSVQGNPCTQSHIYTGDSASPSTSLVAPLSAQASPTTPASPGPGNLQERNQLNLARIEEGLDTRTTVMIKNIPNKMTDRDLIAYIGKVCPRRIDFLYLRMDFTNGCNVGYAFVNFIHVQDLLLFAKKRLGEKWNMFSSEKVLQMSYANYHTRGKEALVEKFKNSCIMDEREEWRPKIFYSTEPNQGLPEPFPPPTHLRRKERSSFNRGALFVPGVTGGTQGPRTHLHNSSRRQNHSHDEQRTYPTRYLERQPHRSRNREEQTDTRNQQGETR